MVHEEEIRLKDEVTPTAKKAQASLVNLTDQMLKAQGAQGNLTDQMLKAQSQMKPVAMPASPPGAAPAAAMKDVWADAAHAAQVGKESVTAALGDIGNAFSALASGDAKGAVVGLVDAIGDMAKLLDLVVPGLGQAASAVIKLAGGVAGFAAGLAQKGMEMAVSASQGKQQMLAMFGAMAGGREEAEKLDDMLSELADSIGVSKDELAPLTLAFLKMGFTGTEALEKLTLAAESAEAIVGKGGAEAFTTLQKRIAAAAEAGGTLKIDPRMQRMLMDTGVSLEDVAKQMGVTKAQLTSGAVDATKFGEALSDAAIKKGAGPLKLLGSTWANITKKFDQDVGDMFEDMSDVVAPFMDALRDLFSIFNASSESGKTMKEGIGGALRLAFTYATQLVPVVKHFLLDVVIYSLQAYIAMKPWVAKIQELWASASKSGVLSKVLEGLKFAAIGIGIAVVAVVVVFGALWAMMVGIGLAVWTVIGAFVMFVTTLYSSVGAGISWLVNMLALLWQTVNNLLGGWPQMALDAAIGFITGIVQGIVSGYTMVTDAVSGLAGSAVDAFKGFLGIASPSKVMMELGGHVAGGLAGGIDDGLPDVHGAMGGVAGAVTGAAGDIAAPAAAARGGAVITVYIQVDGAGKSAGEITEEMVAATFERMALAQGL